jgi:hypothetical protein
VVSFRVVISFCCGIVSCRNIVLFRCNIVVLLLRFFSSIVSFCRFVLWFRFRKQLTVYWNEQLPFCLKIKLMKIYEQPYRKIWMSWLRDYLCRFAIEITFFNRQFQDWTFFCNIWVEKLKFKQKFSLFSNRRFV